MSCELVLRQLASAEVDEKLTELWAVAGSCWFVVCVLVAEREYKMAVVLNISIG